MTMAGKNKARKNAPKKPASPSKDKEHFTRGVMVRGEAVPKGASLVAGATHEIIAADQAGNAVIRRKRFSLA
jgi:hypothetical protein